MKYPFILSLSLFLACSAPKGVSQENNSDKNDQVAQKAISEMTDDELRAFSDTLAHRYIVLDGHVDLPYRMEVAGFRLKKEIMDVSVETTGNFDHPKAVRGGLDAPFMSIYVPSSYQKSGGAKKFADSLISMTMRLPVKYPQLFAAANSPDEIEANFARGLVSLPMGMENGAPIENDLKNVEYFHKRGIRYITLTHSKDNQICDSSYDRTRTWKGLSPFGRQVILEMNRVGIMVDISHVSDQAFYQAMEVSKAPMIASHSSCRKFTPGFERNMDDEMIKLLAKHGGVIHINFGSTFLSSESRERFDRMDEHLKNYRIEKGLKENDPVYEEYARTYAIDNGVFEDVKTVADHIDHVVKLTSIDHVAFGSDFDGVGDSLPTGLKDVSMYPNVIYELLKRGYTEEDIAKICYRNTFRVWREVERVSTEWK
jgi:membrane dipeptidase